VKYTREEKFIKELGKNIRRIRLANHLTQEQLAFEAGISLKQVNRIELGQINTSVSQIYVLAKVLDIPVKGIFDFEMTERSKKK
jgi:transcriptional regulator with XRE-family HTH domain